MTEINAAKVTFNELRQMERASYREQWERWDLARFAAHNQYLLVPCGKNVNRKMDRRDWMPLPGDDDFWPRSIGKASGKIEDWEARELAKVFGITMPEA